MLNSVFGEAANSTPARIVASLRAAILGGEYKAGEKIPAERQLAQQFNTNRNTLREAIRELTALKLVQVRHGGGVRVLDFRRSGELLLLPWFLEAVAGTPEFGAVLADTLEFRSALLSHVASLAARRGGKADIAGLRGALARIREVHAGDDVMAAMLADLGFFEALIDAAHSLVARWTFNTYAGIVVRLLAASPELWVTAPDYLATLEAVVTAVELRAAAAAADALTKHFAAGDKLLWQRLGGTP